MSMIIDVQDLTKRYGGLLAVDKVNFAVEQGEIFGFLGPNGAGKTTCLEMMEGLRKPDGGQVLLKGISVWPNPGKVKNLIGVQLQSTSFYEELTVKEILVLFASLYNRRLSEGQLESLLSMAGLEEKRNAYTNTLSGGQKQRLAIITALVNEPEIIFLDEPTTGLDPQARRRSWEIIRELQGKGKTIILTTHYMEEAENLCARVAIIDQGKIVAIDQPQKLIEQLGKKAKISFASSRPLESVFLAQLGAEAGQVSSAEGQVLFASDPAQTIGVLLEKAKQEGIVIHNLHVSSPSLDDVFLGLTGKELRD
ncbi:MAG: ABC transporter ATP-binding protein [Dethiobacter sp.]|nr:ABC transporter ATP-binding protein [Dethiobacter sp.]MBS3899824.1 ABC transporter ATP-binding protein [Dethiobacter sp.]